MKTKAAWIEALRAEANVFWKLSCKSHTKEGRDQLLESYNRRMRIAAYLESR